MHSTLHISTEVNFEFLFQLTLNISGYAVRSADTELAKMSRSSVEATPGKSTSFTGSALLMSVKSSATYERKHIKANPKNGE